VPIEMYMDGFKQYQIKKLKRHALSLGYQLVDV